MTHTILDLGSTDATLELAGGKGANLAALVRAGFAVPHGFVITTAAYDAFVESNEFAPFILTSIGEPASLDDVSARIRKRFEAGTVPPAIVKDIHAAYEAMGATAVAVRSSATAEDLPEMSFAGQQDTFLNVLGDNALLDAVVRCWSSLWTARAIGYRARNGIANHDVALAVVVQEMVQSEASGVLFTANPLTGKRSETVIDATFGLGEALVSGLVEPDHFVVDEDRIVAKSLGAKAVSIESIEGGGTRQVSVDVADRQSISDVEIVGLAQLGRHVEALFGSPQDIEWALADGGLQLLQSRPITSLFPVPEGLAANPLRALISFGAIQGMLAPMTPLGRDLFRILGSTLARRFGTETTLETQAFVRVAAGRLFIDATLVTRSRHTRRVFREAIANVEPGIGHAFEAISDELAMANPGKPVRISTVLTAASFATRVAFGILRALARPEARRARAQLWIESNLASMRERSLAARTLGERLELLAAFPEEMISSLVPRLVPVVATGVASLALLVRLALAVPDGQRLALEATRGLAHNVTTEMDLALWDVARAIRGDPASGSHFEGASASKLAAEALDRRLPPASQAAVDGFLALYGARGVAEIDLGRTRWREDPTPLMEAIGSYLQIEDGTSAPDAVFARGAAAARESTRALADALRKARFGWFRAPLATWVASRMHALAGMRESPKFTVIRSFGILREGLLESGRELVVEGVFDRPEDLFFLHLPELQAIASGDRRDWRAVVADRRTAFDREMLRRQIPRVLLSDGRALYGGGVPSGKTGDGVLVGTPVSPGVVEGLVRVVLEPHQARLEPGEILVCPGTDPAWTPLFLAAGGLVTEVGGMITHGSVVAREYGIPAVVGVDGATTRLATGQRVRVDGSLGHVTLIEVPVP